MRRLKMKDSLDCRLVCFTVSELPAHHRDLLDRILVAQCQADGLELVTSDEVIARYAVRIMRT
ncbi:MAG: PIN domain-containing protein [Pseudomonadota bacterium]